MTSIRAYTYICTNITTMNFARKIALVGSLLIFPSFIFAQLDPFKEAGKWGLKNSKGEVAVAAIYDKLDGSRYSGMFLVKQNNKYGFLNKSGKVLDQIIYDS